MASLKFEVGHSLTPSQAQSYRLFPLAISLFPIKETTLKNN
jgi:hypothetical protein